MPLPRDNGRCLCVRREQYKFLVWQLFSTYDTDAKHRLSCGNQARRQGDNQDTVF